MKPTTTKKTPRSMYYGWWIVIAGGVIPFEDYEKLERARLLTTSEYTLNSQLGYISLNQALNNDEVLAVAFQYTIGNNIFQVGELSTTGPTAPDALFVKLLKGTNFSPQLPNWDLMMKNIYNLNATQIENENFDLKIYYRDDAIGFNNPSINEGILTRNKPLIRLLGLDKLNYNNDPQSDGNFDFVEGFTIDSKKGNIIFPVLEPFGSTLNSYFLESNETNLSEKYVFEELYSTTKSDAEKILSKNIYIKGKRYGRSLKEMFFTIGMSIFEIIILKKFLWDINSQPNIIHKSFFLNLNNAYYY